MNKITVNGYTRISKQAARKLYEAGEPIYMDGCKMQPGNVWSTTARVAIHDYDDTIYVADSFQDMVNNFEYYNCSSATGRYAAFYTKEDNNNEISKG